VDFIRFVGDEVVRVETMKVGGEKMVKTEKEIEIKKPESVAQQAEQPRPADAPTLRRPGEAMPDAPKTMPGGPSAPLPPPPPPTNSPGSSTPN
jgi:hypothetical protein